LPAISTTRGLTYFIPAIDSRFRAPMQQCVISSCNGNQH
jgi:hypothetical protein